MIEQMFFRSKQSTAWLALVSVCLKNKIKKVFTCVIRKSELEIGGKGGGCSWFFRWKILRT